MKTAWKFILTSFLLTVMLFIAAPAFADYTTSVNSFLSEGAWKPGTRWDGDQHPKSDGNENYWGCAAYAYDYARYVWGTDSYHGGYQYDESSNIMDGDVVKIASWNEAEGREDTHFYVVLKVLDNGNFWTVEGNTDSKVYESSTKYSKTNIWPYYSYFSCGWHNPNYQPYNGTTGKPTITSVTVSNVTKDGYDINFDTDRRALIGEIRVGTWNNTDGIDNAQWAYAYNAVAGTVHVDISSFNTNTNIEFYSNVYVISRGNEISDPYTSPPVYIENEPPVIVDARIENITASGYDVICSAVDNIGISKIRIGTWHDNIHIDNAKWQEATVQNGTAVFHVSIADFSNAVNVTYHTNAFAYDYCNNISEVVRCGDADIIYELPTMTDFQMISTWATGYSFYCKASGGVGVKKLRIGTWHDNMSIDDAHWIEVSADSGSFNISAADFGNALGTTYHTNIFIYDELGFVSEAIRVADVFLKSGVTVNMPVITKAYLDNITIYGYDVVCEASGNGGIAKIRIGTWNDNMSIDNAIWQEAVTYDGTARFHVSIGDFGNAANVIYHTNVFAHDFYGNVSDGVRCGDAEIIHALPQITSVQIIKTWQTGYSFYCKASGDAPIVRLRIGTWHDNMSIDDAQWQEFYAEEGKFNITAASFSNALDTTYHTNIFAYDSDGYISEVYRAVDQYLSSSAAIVAPSVTSTVTNEITLSGYDVTCEAVGNGGIAKLRIGTWNDSMSIDDAIWQEAVTYDGIARFHINIIDFDGKTDVMYHTNVFAYDYYGNISEGIRVADVKMMSLPSWDFTLPAKIITVEDEAFSGTAAKAVKISKTCSNIGSNAFADSALESIYIPSSVTEIGNNALPGDVIIFTDRGSYAALYAIENNYTVIYTE